MTTLVTGASGHLGANLVRALLERGEKVRVLIRKESNNAAIDDLDVEHAYGDLRDEQSIIEAVKGCHYVYHLAAFVSIRDGDRKELYDVNVLGTRYLMQACRLADVIKVVHCSSFGAVGNNPDGASNEKWAVSPYEMTTDYEISKTFAELEVYKEVVRGLQAVIVNPSGIVGPWDFKPSLLGKTIIEFAQGKMHASVPGGFDFTPVQDVVQGHLLAMDTGVIGERYLLTGEQHTINETLDWLEEYTGASKPRIVIPTFIMQNIALVKDWVERKFFPHLYPRFNYHSIRLLNCGKYGTHTRAINELGLQPTPVKEAYRDSVQWFKEHGFISK
ncbi:MAG: SDR family oxidoreductase [Gammaproteobacteria bacterium]|jgi:nucleoside-diphosphate-sugar epimerase|nr:SDR family oxidoreductase [Gammaproteobacteria bacterium]MBT5222522.1 SDR family oxidoreductase [Gammaproteobacteria bacterium]MBT5825914.1 SDR family oxidoreductase [Gammaproteobacteria bacterium]MBT6420706.1 SDR family oxidoreductase [Gammaproteobacteria bacterium]MBT6575408.1 SDR family oxidoreductase [Gammaproteobacteria bacterium]